MYRRLLLLMSICSLLCILSVAAHAQSRVITGTITDVGDGTALPGVTVADNAKAVTTSTNKQGKYTITIPAGTKSLTFSYIGYQAKTVTITSADIINATLSSASNNLEEVVVVSVGYGTLDKREVSSSITHVSGKDLLTVSSNNPLMSLQGKVPGLNITNTSGGDPNSSPSIQLRGVSSRNAGLGQLYVVNGIP